MLEIKFSHDYPKLHGQKRARLLYVKTATREMLDPDFIEYDTKFPGGYYPLPDGKYIVLCFIGEKFIPFTTVRPWRLEKECFYTESRGQAFTILIERKQ